MPHRAGHEAALSAIMLGDPARRAALEAVRALALPDCWVGAGFVRDAVWGHLHGDASAPIAGDVDVIWFDPARASACVDVALEQDLGSAAPGYDWSVRNQARMHLRNGDAPYRSACDAMRYWPETATAVAVRLADDGNLNVIAPFGLADLFAARLVPTAGFAVRKRTIFDRRVEQKRWLERYPLLSRA